MNDPSHTEPTTSAPVLPRRQRFHRHAEPTPAAPVHPLRALACGLAMGVADAVPGVSGGTIALILGIYRHLIAALGAVADLVRAPWRGDRWRAALATAWFLGPLLLGAGVALVLAVKLLVGGKPDLEAIPDAELPARLAGLPGLLLNPATAPIVFGFFFGLVVASLREPWQRRASHRGVDWLLAAAGATLAASLALSPALGGSSHPAALIAAGGIAISVMLLPGISGSLALLVLGMYQPVSQAVHDRDVVVVALFGVGLVIGAVAFVPLLRALLARHHDRTMAVLSGLMAGSLAALWPWKVHYLPNAIPRLGPMAPVAPNGSWWWPLVAAMVGAILILALARFGRRFAESTP